MTPGRILVALILIFGLVGVLTTGAALYTRILYLGILLIVTAWIWTRWSVRGLRMNRYARVLRANVGDVFEEKFELMNNNRIIVPWIEVFNHSSIPFAAGSRLFTYVGRRQKQSYLARTWLTSRGGFQLGPTHISTGDPFGLFAARREFPSAQTLVVLPVIYPLNTFIFPPGLLPGGQVIRRKSADVTPHAAGVREYVHGDAMKRIHWPTSARRGKLMVKEFEQDPQAEVWLFLDLQQNVHYVKQHQMQEIPAESLMYVRRPKFKLPPSTLEYAISITASLAHYFLGQRRSVGYVSAGQTFVVHPADHSERQEAKILETLAFVEANGGLSLAALVGAQASQLPQGSSVILVTSSMRSDLLHAVDDLQRRFLRPVVVLLDAASFGGPRSADSLLTFLQDRRVPVISVQCDADLSQTLSVLPSNLQSQELKTWQKQTSSPLT